MKTLSRHAFILTANAVWFAQFAVEAVAPLIGDYLVWRQKSFMPDNRLGCFSDAYYDSLTERLFLLALLWIVTAPVMNLIAWKNPRIWPPRLIRFCWHRTAAALSWTTMLAALAVMVWPVSTAANAPVTSMLVMQTARALILLAALLYYRAILLSAEPHEPPSHPAPADR
jgi:hypothetical protein